MNNCTVYSIAIFFKEVNKVKLKQYDKVKVNDSLILVGDKQLNVAFDIFAQTCFSI